MGVMNTMPSLNLIGLVKESDVTMLITQLVKNPPTMQETPVQFLGWERSPGEGIGYLLQYLKM